MGRPFFKCGYCGRKWGIQAGLSQHLGHSAPCKKHALAVDPNILPILLSRRRSHSPTSHASAQPTDNGANDTINNGSNSDNGEFQSDHGDEEPPRKRPRTTVEDAEDEGESEGEHSAGHKGPVIEYHPTAGKIIERDCGTRWQSRLEEDQAKDLPPWAPFADEDEMEHGHWMWETGMSQKAMDKGLKLKIVSETSYSSRMLRRTDYQSSENETRDRTKLSSESSAEFLKKIDTLPTGATFERITVTITGDLKHPSGEYKTDDLEMFARDPVECVRELMGNPDFKDHTVYGPMKIYTSADRKTRVYSEMCTGDYWNELQVGG